MAENSAIKAGNELPVDRCPHCSVKKPRISLVHRFSTSPYSGGQRYWIIYQCSTCGGVVTVRTATDKSGDVVEMFPSARSIDGSIPERAQRHLQETVDTLQSPGASIVAAASAVDAMLKARGYREGSLYERIDRAATEHLITGEMAAWAHQIRLDANEMRHAHEDAPFPEFDDAKLCLDFALALGDVLFVLPARVTRGRENASASASASPSPEEE